ncbi:tetratricopeptide repeat protein [Schaalia suimastitidis]|uniref:tetratricopeptide repeat protein n=1 Tax=Schaalia suimastitidis TaxID=121163 RepID=UPI003B835025
MTVSSTDPMNMGHAPAAKQEVYLNIPLITTADESNFDDVVATSQALPVVIVMWAAQALESRSVLDTMEDLAREGAGNFQLVTIDVEKTPAVIQAFQIQALPAVVALIGGRPVPMLQGSASKEQIRPLLAQLREAAEQMGASARVAVNEADTAPPTPEEHLPALRAEEAGDLDHAIALWEKLIELNPRDEAAKAQVARVRLAQRAARAQVADDPEATADALFAAGAHDEAFEVLLTAMREAAPEDRDQLRTRLLDLFRVAGNTDEVRRARRQLTTLLMI